MHLLGRKPPGQEEDDPATAINNAVESDDEYNREDEDEAVRLKIPSLHVLDGLCSPGCLLPLKQHALPSIPFECSNAVMMVMPPSGNLCKPAVDLAGS